MKEEERRDVKKDNYVFLTRCNAKETKKTNKYCSTIFEDYERETKEGYMRTVTFSRQYKTPKKYRKQINIKTAASSFQEYKMGREEINKRSFVF